MILITGANGFLGKYICQAIPAAERCTLSRTDQELAIDIQAPFRLPDRHYKTIIHAAGKAHSIPKNAQEEQAFLDINAGGTQNLLRALSQQSRLPESFVLISTVAVYGLEQGMNIHEDTPLLASSAYGKSKILAEQYVQEWCQQHGVRCTILRLPLLAGTNPPGNLGKMQQAVLQGKYYNIAGGTARKSMVLASDVAQVILPLSALGGIYHLTDGIHPTFGQLSRAMAVQAGKKAPRSIPYALARILAGIGSMIPGFPFNQHTLDKMMADLTFNDDHARRTGLWKPQSVLDFYQ